MTRRGFLPVKPYLDANLKSRAGAFVLFGAPMDATASARPGARFGPPELRIASDGIENYCPILDREIADSGLEDWGDLELPYGDANAALAAIRAGAEQILAEGKRPFLLGGEHLVSLPVIEALAERHAGLCVVQFDAHADLREDYLGVRLSHATVMRRVLEIVSSANLFQFGVRSGTREEWTFMRAHGTVWPITADALAQARQTIGARPVYVTVDLDVLDPACLPGTGTPESGGVTFAQLDEALRALCGLNVVGADVVELAPQLDPNGISAFAAAKLVRTMGLGYGSP